VVSIRSVGPGQEFGEVIALDSRYVVGLLGRPSGQFPHGSFSEL